MNIHDHTDAVEYQTAVEVQMRKVSDEQMHQFEGYAAEILSAFGLDLNTSATKDTPRRFIRALFDATEGYDGDPKLLKVFETECRGEPDCRLSQVVEGPIPFFALCEHHALPFYGKAYVGYIAHENIIGISKLTRLTRLFSKRFTVQERIGQQIADTLDTMLHPAVPESATTGSVQGADVTIPVEHAWSLGLSWCHAQQREQQQRCASQRLRHPNRVPHGDLPRGSVVTAAGRGRSYRVVASGVGGRSASRRR